MSLTGEAKSVKPPGFSQVTQTIQEQLARLSENRKRLSTLAEMLERTPPANTDATQGEVCAPADSLLIQLNYFASDLSRENAKIETVLSKLSNLLG